MSIIFSCFPVFVSTCSLHYCVFHHAGDEYYLCSCKKSRFCVRWLDLISRWLTTPLAPVFSIPAIYSRTFHSRLSTLHFYRIAFPVPHFQSPHGVCISNPFDQLNIRYIAEVQCSCEPRTAAVTQVEGQFDHIHADSSRVPCFTV